MTTSYSVNVNAHFAPRVGDGVGDRDGGLRRNAVASIPVPDLARLVRASVPRLPL
jgi:hypothetical protein